MQCPPIPNPEALAQASEILWQHAARERDHFQRQRVPHAAIEHHVQPLERVAGYLEALAITEGVRRTEQTVALILRGASPPESAAAE